MADQEQGEITTGDVDGMRGATAAAELAADDAEASRVGGEHSQAGTIPAEESAQALAGRTEEAASSAAAAAAEARQYRDSLRGVMESTGAAASSPRRLTAQADAERVLLRWERPPGMGSTYQVQTSTDGVAWTDLATDLRAGYYIHESPGEGTRYYRVRTETQAQRLSFWEGPARAQVGTRRLADVAPGAAMHYGLRTGPGTSTRLIRADGTERDFEATEIGDGTLASWAGDSDVHVERYYDKGQAGEALVFEDGQRPVIVQGGDLVRNGSGEIDALWDGITVTLPVDVDTSAITLGVVASAISTDGDRAMIEGAGTDMTLEINEGEEVRWRVGGASAGEWRGHEYTYGVAASRVYVATRQGDHATLYVDGATAAAVQEERSGGSRTLTVGGYSGGSRYWHGFISQVVVHESEEDARTLSEALRYPQGRPVSTDQHLAARAGEPLGGFAWGRQVSALHARAGRVVRDSDGQKTWIGWDDQGALDTDALASFCAGTTGRVDRLYDPSGQHMHLYAITEDLPVCYDEGATPRDEWGTAALFFTGTEALESATAFHENGVTYAFDTQPSEAAFQNENDSFLLSNNSSLSSIYINNSCEWRTRLRGDVANDDSLFAEAGRQQIVVAQAQGGQISVWGDQHLWGRNAQGEGLARRRLRFGGPGGSGWRGLLSSGIVFPGDADAQAIIDEYARDPREGVEDDRAATFPDSTPNQWIYKRAIRHVGEYDRVYVSAPGMEFGHLWQHDLSTGLTSGITLDDYGGDDHDAGSILPGRGGGPMRAFIAQHSGSAEYPLVELTGGVEDFTQGVTTRGLPLTGSDADYTQVHEYEDGDRLLIFTRYDGAWGVIVSEDGGQTHGDFQRICDGFRAYPLVREHGDDMLSLTYHAHPTSGGLSQDITRFLMDPYSGDVSDLDGALLGNAFTGSDLPLRFTDGTPLYIADEGDHTRLFTATEAGEVVMGYWTGDTADGIYRYIGADGSVEDLVASGGPIESPDSPGYIVGYYGGACFLADETVALARRDGNTWLLELWERSGGSWATKTLAESQKYKIYRPYPVYGMPAALVYGYGRYRRYTDFAGHMALLTNVI